MVGVKIILISNSDLGQQSEKEFDILSILICYRYCTLPWYHHTINTKDKFPMRMKIEYLKGQQTVGPPWPPPPRISRKKGKAVCQRVLCMICSAKTCLPPDRSKKKENYYDKSPQKKCTIQRSFSSKNFADKTINHIRKMMYMLNVHVQGQYILAPDRCAMIYDDDQYNNPIQQ